jgi:hypothetical protein
MRPLSDDDPDSSDSSKPHSAFIESLSSFSRLHRAQRWEGTFAEFLTNVVARQSGGRGPHQSPVHLGHAALAWPRQR